MGKANSRIKRKDKDKCLMSMQTREDIQSLLLGFVNMCEEKFKCSNSSIVPARVNSDVIENVFSQQRGIHNGANPNPDYLTYSRTINTIIIGEAIISRKSNTSGDLGAMFQTSLVKTSPK